ncbi:hypothetical protein ACHAWF_015913 [Thalassiosira exigua]
MVVSTRHLHRKNLRRAGDALEYDDHDANDHGPSPRHPRITPQSLTQSSAVLEALSDANSKLARFLFIGGGAAAGQEESSWFSSFRRGDDGDDEMPSMGDVEAQCYALALEPMEIRNERIIMLFEGYAIFGALFMGAIWILYEYGNEGGGDGSNIIVRRIFGFLMALALSCNMFLALFGAWYWIYSIMLNSSHQDFVFQSIRPLAHLYYLLCFNGNLVGLGMLLGIYLNLSPYLPEAIVSMVISFAILFSGAAVSYSHMSAVSPLELYHLPAPMRNYFVKRGPTKVEAGDLKARAKVRAQELRKRAKATRQEAVQEYNERRKLESNLETNGVSPMGTLLRNAAMNCGRNNGISEYEARLHEDWLTKPEQLKGLGLEYLSRYMPLGLAKEVQRMVEIEEETGCRL